MKTRAIVIIIVVFCLASLIALPFVSSQGMPHAIFGTVRNGDGVPVASAAVTLKNGRTDDTLSTTTDSLGQYTADLSAMPGGFQTGDVITVKAVSGDMSGSSTVAVSVLPLDQCDIVISKNAVLNPIVLGAAVIGLVAIVILAVLYSRAQKEPPNESSKGRRRE